MPKIDSRAVIKRAKEKPQKGNYTFRFDDRLMEEIRKVCEKEDVTMTALLEELMRLFLDSKK